MNHVSNKAEYTTSLTQDEPIAAPNLTDAPVEKSSDKPKNLLDYLGQMSEDSPTLESMESSQVSRPSQNTNVVSSSNKPVTSLAEVAPWEDVPSYLDDDPSQPPNSSEVPETLEYSKREVTQNMEKKDVGTSTIDREYSLRGKDCPWHQVIPQLLLHGRAKELLKHCLLKEITEETIFLNLTKDREDLLSNSIKQEILNALKSFYGDNIRLEMQVTHAESQNNNRLETPAQRSDREMVETQQQAEDNIMSDPFVVELNNRFGAKVVPGSIRLKNKNIH